ncbi:MAG: hypothetical protein Q4G10_03830 [Bacteroidia bacterium]|nr:hypothetical protein [Bacteroidia bacterium]
MKLIEKYLPADYCDCVSKRLNAFEGLNADYVFEQMFCNFPKPAAWLMKLRMVLSQVACQKSFQ